MEGGIVALRELGLPLDEVAAVLGRGEPGLAEIVRRQLGRVQSELDRHRRLRDRLGVVLATLERSGWEPSADQLIDAMEEMTVIADVTEVARILGTSRAGAAELCGSAPGFPGAWVGPEGYLLWPRAAVESWAARCPDRGPRRRRLSLRPPAPGQAGRGTDRILAIAEAEARALNHGWVGADHLILALLHPGWRRSRRLKLEDEEVTSSHLLVALVGDWGGVGLTLRGELPGAERAPSPLGHDPRRWLP